jgi:DNA-binding NtrC family response regulator
MNPKHNEQPKRAYDRDSNVLIVDDDGTLLKFFKIHLNKFFSKVVVVEGAKEALDVMKTKEVDLLLTDVRMPKVDGLELMTKVRKAHPDIPVLLISGEPMSDEQKKMIALADGFLAKPFTVDELNQYILGGIDLRNEMKKLLPHLKDPKKIRETFDAKPDAISKLVKKGDKADVDSCLAAIKSLRKKAS